MSWVTLYSHGAVVLHVEDDHDRDDGVDIDDPSTFKFERISVNNWDWTNKERDAFIRDFFRPSPWAESVMALNMIAEEGNVQ